MDAEEGDQWPRRERGLVMIRSGFDHLALALVALLWLLVVVWVVSWGGAGIGEILGR